jgi:hypothetical protein
LPESNKPAADHLVDFEKPLYNVWKQHVLGLSISATMRMRMRMKISAKLRLRRD